MITPREMLRDYMTVLNILLQNDKVSFADIAGTAVTLKTAADEEDEPKKPASRPSVDPDEIEI
jgi:hypothetical protein